MERRADGFLPGPNPPRTRFFPRFHMPIELMFFQFRKPTLVGPSAEDRFCAKESLLSWICVPSNEETGTSMYSRRLRRSSDRRRSKVVGSSPASCYQSCEFPGSDTLSPPGTGWPFCSAQEVWIVWQSGLLASRTEIQLIASGFRLASSDATMPTP